MSAVVHLGHLIGPGAGAPGAVAIETLTGIATGRFAGSEASVVEAAHRSLERIIKSGFMKQLFHPLDDTKPQKQTARRNTVWKHLIGWVSHHSCSEEALLAVARQVESLSRSLRAEIDAVPGSSEAIQKAQARLEASTQRVQATVEAAVMPPHSR